MTSSFQTVGKELQYSVFLLAIWEGESLFLMLGFTRGWTVVNLRVNHCFLQWLKYIGLPAFFLFISGVIYGVFSLICNICVFEY